MIELEKILYALNCRATNAPSTCAECSYYVPKWSCCNLIQIMNDALDLLNTQKTPKVMTEDDILHPTEKPLWFESRGMYLGQKGFWCLLFEIDSKFQISFVQSITGGKITLSLFDYGKVWRFWSAKPTEEQRKAVKWDDRQR